MGVFVEKLSRLHQKMSGDVLKISKLQKHFKIRRKTIAVQGKTTKTTKVLALEHFILYSISDSTPYISYYTSMRSVSDSKHYAQG